jgi:hypothetical protein
MDITVCRCLFAVFSELSVAWNRVRLAWMLRERGVYVRLHAYEYLLGFGGRILGVLLLEPSRGVASLYLSERSEASDRLVGIVDEVLGGFPPRLSLRVVWRDSSL